jgi:hypothetical protein
MFVPKCELIAVEREVSAADVMIDTVHTTLQQREKPFDGVGVRAAQRG